MSAGKEDRGETRTREIDREEDHRPQDDCAQGARQEDRGEEDHSQARIPC